jgi:hypothetical protein
VKEKLHGLDGRISIIKEAAIHHFKMPSSVYKPIAATLGAIGEHKKYHDGANTRAHKPG